MRTRDAHELNSIQDGQEDPQFMQYGSTVYQQLRRNQSEQYGRRKKEMMERLHI